ncbi:rhamnulokinase family protein [Bacteroidota bacterium]
MDNKERSFSCLAVDMGAGSVRIMLGLIRKQSIRYEEIHRTPNAIEEIDGHERWDITGLFKEIVIGINKAIEVSENKPQSIGVDSWGVDFVLLNEVGELLDIPIAYRDSRTEGMMEAWEKELFPFETFKRTGINFYIFNTLFQLFSMHDSDLLKQTKRILFIPSYINFLLSGVAENEQTIASTSQVLGIDGQNWDSDILAKLGISASVLGEVIEPGKKLGQVVFPGIDQSSIESVAVCGHDTACAIAAIPAKDANFAFISTGTWCILGLETANPLLSEEAYKMGFTNERGYNDTFRSLKNIVGLWLVQGLKKEYPEATGFSELEKMVSTIGQTKQFIDPDDALFFNPSNMKEAFDEFFEKTGQDKPGDTAAYIKIAYDSLCFSFRYLLEFLESHTEKRIDRIHVIGGGCQSDYFNQHIATICNKEVYAGPVEGSVIGNILVQAISMGEVKSLEEGRMLVRNSFPVKHYSPTFDTEKYNKVYAQYINYKLKQI